MEMDLDFDLNPDQRAAAEATEGALLVVAGAGTGKTRVIEARTAMLLERGVPPERILLMTFTRKAAQEMLLRAAMRHPLAAKVDGGTFHGVAYRIVSRYHQVLGLPRAPTIIDEDDAANAIASVIARHGLDQDKERRLPKKTAMAQLFSRATNLGRPLREVVEAQLPDFADVSDRMQAVRKAYIHYKWERAYVDYDDLLVLTAQLLSKPDLARRVASSWDYLLVDEYQDVNTWQAEIAIGLAREHGNLMVVGDPRQSIYAFRGARVGKIQAFTGDLPGAQVVHLTENYRSSQAILDAANAVMQLMEDEGSRRPLQAHAARQGEKPWLRVFPDAQEVARHVADTVQPHLDDPAGLSGFAVLYRNGFQGIPLQGELLRRKIPFRVFGGRRFTELAHVKDTLAYLRVLHNPFDELAWLRLLQLLPGLGPAKSARLFADAADPEALATTGEAGPVERALNRHRHHLKGETAEAAEGLLLALKAAAAKGSVLEAYDAVLGHYEAVLQRTYDQVASRRADLLFFRVVVSAYEGAPQRGLGTLLSDLTLEPEALRKSEARPAEGDEGIKRLTLSTIHSAKGLEWDHVFIVGMEDGQLPSRKALRSTEGGDELEEEKRLLYVALTRARDRLEVNHALYSQFAMNEVSRFLADERVAATFETVVAGSTVVVRPETTGRLDVQDVLAVLAGED